MRTELVLEADRATTIITYDCIKMEDMCFITEGYDTKGNYTHVYCTITPN